jgi:hypothetical protein
MLNHGGDLIYVQKPQGACFRCVFGWTKSFTATINL